MVTTTPKWVTTSHKQTTTQATTVKTELPEEDPVYDT